MEKVKVGAEQLVEALTKRERAILAHLLAEKSNADIAELETLAGETVKWYVKQIYAKLGVNKREEVAERARELGLAQPSAGSFAAPERPKHNLPAQLTSFIGREKEIGELRLLLRKKETRLATLTGSGGTGKTRLALQTAAGLVEAFADGVWQVELAPLPDPDLVPQTVLSALEQVEQQGKTPIAQLADYLREKHLLLILDNCEHLVAACAKLAHALLQGAPGLKILASSREILGVGGEQTYRVPPLKMPDARQLPALEELANTEAVRLLVERAQAVNPTFTLTEENAAAVARITQRLDGIPLALELAAARLRVLSVEQIAERLQDVFRLLTGGSRTALPRHQTLAALIDWSYNLLTEGERRGLRALSAFAGSWTLEGAEAVCGAEALDLLEGLADKSLIFTAPGAGGGLRYRMLETVRQYAHARLVEAGEAEGVRNRHLGYYLHLAERLEPNLRGREQIATLDAIEYELDNLRLALEWGLQADGQAELRLASALKWFWHIRYHWTEGIGWLEQGLEVEKKRREDPSVQGRGTLVSAKAQLVLGFHLSRLELNQGQKACHYLEKAKRLYESDFPEDRTGLGWALLYLGFYMWDAGECGQARNLAEEARSLFHGCDERYGMAECLQLLGDCERDVAQKLKYFQEQLSIVEAIGDSDGIATAFGHVAGIGFWTGEYSDASAGFIASREYYRAAENPHMVAKQTQMIGVVSHLNGDLERAARELEEVHDRLREFGLENDVNFNLHWRYLLALANGRYDLAERLTDTLDRNAQMAGNPVWVTNVLFQRARLSRLKDEFAAAQRYAEEGLVTGQGLGYPRILNLLELGLLALRENEFEKSKILFFNSLQAHVDSGDIGWLGCCIEGLALLAVRERQMERAARLSGTRLWRGFFHILSPSERAERAADFAAITAALGAERFEQLREEGRELSYPQVLALAQEE